VRLAAVELALMQHGVGASVLEGCVMRVRHPGGHSLLLVRDCSQRDDFGQLGAWFPVRQPVRPCPPPAAARWLRRD
jgi:hypothetical protein